MSSGDGEGGADTQTAQRAGIQPLAGSEDVDGLGAGADNIATIADDDRIRINELVYLRAEPKMIYRCIV